MKKKQWELAFFREKVVEPLRREIGKVCEAFPEEAEELIIVSERDLLYASKENLEILKERPDMTQLLIDVFGQIPVKEGSKGITLKEEKIIAIPLADEFYESANRVDYNQEMDTLFTTNHELAHMFIDKAEHNNNESESLADAFATIEHVKSFGKNLSGLLSVHSSGVYIFIDNSFLIYDKDPVSHFTFPAIKKVAELSKTVDFNKLEMSEIAEVSTLIGNKYSLGDKKLNRLLGVFNPVAKANSISVEEELDATMDLILRTKDHDVFRICWQLLNVLTNIQNNTEDKRVSEILEILDEKCTAENIERDFVKFIEQDKGVEEYKTKSGIVLSI